MIIGEYSPIITEPEANNCFSIITNFVASFVLLGVAFSLKQLISSSIASTKRLAAILKNRLGDYRVIITSIATNQR